MNFMAFDRRLDDYAMNSGDIWRLRRWLRELSSRVC